MHFSELTAPEQRVLGCLIEKCWTTPEQYPLSLNALRLACNQATNRDPVTEYDEATVRDAAQRLSRYGLTRLASGHSSRATKYRHLAEEALGLDRPALAVLAVLLLRGPQTPGEIKSRSERMAPASLAEVEATLEMLIERGYAIRMPRRPGQKEERFTHRLDGDAAGSPPAASALETAAFAPATVTPGVGASAMAPAPPAAPPGVPAGAPGASPADGRLAERVEALETEVAQLRAQLERLADELGVAVTQGAD